jgi:hypothetical protein
MTLKQVPIMSGFGVRVDGRDTGISFPRVADARGGTHRLLAHGYQRVEIFDRESGRVIEHVIPHPTAA